jgi:hypothetical protein
MNPAQTDRYRDRVSNFENRIESNGIRLSLPPFRSSGSSMRDDCGVGLPTPLHYVICADYRHRGDNVTTREARSVKPGSSAREVITRAPRTWNFPEHERNKITHRACVRACVRACRRMNDISLGLRSASNSRTYFSQIHGKRQSMWSQLI